MKPKSHPRIRGCHEPSVHPDTTIHQASLLAKSIGSRQHFEFLLAMNTNHIFLLTITLLCSFSLSFAQLNLEDTVHLNAKHDPSLDPFAQEVKSFVVNLSEKQKTKSLYMEELYVEASLDCSFTFENGQQRQSTRPFGNFFTSSGRTVSSYGPQNAAIGQGARNLSSIRTTAIR